MVKKELSAFLLLLSLFWVSFIMFVFFVVDDVSRHFMYVLSCSDRHKVWGKNNLFLEQCFRKKSEICSS